MLDGFWLKSCLGDQPLKGNRIISEITHNDDDHNINIEDV